MGGRSTRPPRALGESRPPPEMICLRCGGKGKRREKVVIIQKIEKGKCEAVVAQTLALPVHRLRRSDRPTDLSLLHRLTAISAQHRRQIKGTRIEGGQLVRATAQVVSIVFNAHLLLHQLLFAVGEHRQRLQYRHWWQRVKWMRQCIVVDEWMQFSVHQKRKKGRERKSKSEL